VAWFEPSNIRSGVNCSTPALPQLANLELSCTLSRTNCFTSKAAAKLDLLIHKPSLVSFISKIACFAKKQRKILPTKLVIIIPFTNASGDIVSDRQTMCRFE
jgi:hypothetical protein